MYNRYNVRYQMRLIPMNVRVVESGRAQLCLKEAILFAVRVQDSFALDLSSVRFYFHFPLFSLFSTKTTFPLIICNIFCYVVYA